MPNLPASRKDAIANGETKYFTNKLCKQGHLSYRYVSSGICASCASEKAKISWASGKNKQSKNRSKNVKQWNDSEKAKTAKQRWKTKNPKLAWATSAIGGAKLRAALKGVVFDLTSKYVESITPERCPVFHEPFVFAGNKVPQPFSATLDRLDPSKGYVQGNVVVISMKANSIKNAYGSEEVKKVADWLQQQGY
jgi:hypothetical protein